MWKNLSHCQETNLWLTPSDQDNHPAVEVVDMIEDKVVNKVTKMKLVLFFHSYNVRALWPFDQTYVSSKCCKFIKYIFTLRIMKILVTLIVMRRPHVMAKPQEERPKQSRARGFGKWSKNKPAKIWKLWKHVDCYQLSLIPKLRESMYT